jgi:hypothetical protein
MRKLPKKRACYLHLLEAGTGQFFLEMPETAAVQLREMLEGESSYRGITCEFSRSKADNGRFRFEVDPYTEKRLQIPKGKDPEETLRTLWAWGRQA